MIIANTNTQKKVNKNTNLNRRCNSIPWTITIQQRRLKWFGHLHRLPEDSPAKTAYKEVTEKPVKKTKGGQKLTWHQTIIRDLKTIDIDLQKAIKLSKDRVSVSLLSVIRFYQIKTPSVMYIPIRNNQYPALNDSVSSSYYRQGYILTCYQNANIPM